MMSFSVIAAVLLLQGQIDPLTSQDVAIIASESIRASLTATQSARARDIGMPLLLDVGSSNRRFEEAGERSLPIDSARWLPSSGFGHVRTADITKCPSPAAPVHHCRLLLTGTLASIAGVTRTGENAYEVYVQFLSNPDTALRQTLVGTFAKVRVTRVNGRWEATVVEVATS